MRRIIKKIISCLLIMSIIFGMTSINGIATNNVVYADNDTIISRVQWVHDLTELFEMTVEEDNYPDNYFSDINEESEYYRDVMVAVEFGLVDIEAGEAFYPDEPVTRDFAASTMNYCLGYQLEEATYTFLDYEDSAYPDDAQIAINRGWFTLIDGKFKPDQNITADEKDIMFADAGKIIAATEIDYTYNNEFEFADDVIDLPENTVYSKDENNTFTILDSPIELVEGSKFAIYTNGLPEIFKATKVTINDNITTVETVIEDAEGNVVGAEAQGCTSAQLAEAEGVDGAEISYILGGTAAKSYEDGLEFTSKRLAGAIPISAVKVSKTITLSNGIKASFSVVISDLVVDYKISCIDQEAYLIADGTTTVTSTVTVDVLESLGYSGSFEIVKVPVGGVGEFVIAIDYSLQGQVTFTYVTDFVAGFQYNSNGFRFIKDFEKKSFTVAAEAEMSTGIRASLSLVKLPVVSGSVYAKAGVTTKISVRSHDDGKAPNICTHLSSHLYASVGVSAGLDFKIKKYSFNESYTFFSEKNSPIRVAFHYEDGEIVPYCTRNKDDYYYSSWDTRYGSNGMRYGSSGTGVLEVPTWTYDVVKDEETAKEYAIVTGYNGGGSALVIPETLDGYEVREIGYEAFKNNDNLYTVIIPNSITVIGYNAFYDCDSLSEIKIPDSVTDIGTEAFYDCNSLSKVELSKSLENLYWGTFGNCDSLTSIEIPKSLESGGNGIEGPFSNCDGLKNVTFEEGTTKVPMYLFAYCTGLEKIELPNTITSIEYSAFYNCDALCEIKIPDSVTEIGKEAFYDCNSLSKVELSKSLENLYWGTFGNCDSLTSIEIPKSLESGGNGIEGPFSNCDGLKNVTFEEGTTKVPMYLFAYCTGLEKIELPNTITSIEYSAFYNCDALCEITIPNSVTEIRPSAFAECDSLSKVELSKSLKTLDWGAFDNCDLLTSIDIPKGLEYSGYGSTGPFSNCDGLKNVTFEEGITKIPEYLFSHCTGLEKIELPNTITSIEYSAFYNCDALSEITIPNSVTEIGPSAFAECDSLSKVELSKSLKTLDWGAFENCDSLTSIEIPNSINKIDNYILCDCDSLSKISIPDSVTEIGAASFSDCDALESIVIPDSVKVIGRNLFDGCEKLESVKLSSNMERISSNCFIDCIALNNIEIPNSITEIDVKAFSNCDSLESISIPNSVTYIGDSAFNDCDKLKDVKLGTGITAIPNSCFEHCDVLESIVIPYRVTNIGYNVFKDCVKLSSLTIPRNTTSIDGSAISYPDRLTIYGVVGTTAETYANEKGAKFIANDVKAETVSLSKTEITMYEGETAKIDLSIEPINFIDEVDWKTTNSDIITVSDTGEITAEESGTATIKVTVGDLSVSCKVTVLQPVEYVSLDSGYVVLEALSTYQLNANVYPEDAYNNKIEWSSSDEDIATVDQNGLVTVYAKGEAVITAKALDGSDCYDSCTFVVENNGYKIEDVSKMESSHPYTNNGNDFWLYQLEGASDLVITFDEKTELEEGFDFLYIYDGSGNEVGKYTGTELSNKTISVEGDTVKIKLLTDKGGSAYGFKVADIVVPTETPTLEPTETPTVEPTVTPTIEPTVTPTIEPTETPTIEPAETPTVEPTETPTIEPTGTPTVEPTETPTIEPTGTPTVEPTETPTIEPTGTPTVEPTETPTIEPTGTPTIDPTIEPTEEIGSLGDVNNDGFIDASDALDVLKHAARLSSVNDTNFADTNKDGGVDATDALQILKYAAKIINSFD